jgi:hypothetical protein
MHCYNWSCMNPIIYGAAFGGCTLLFSMVVAAVVVWKGKASQSGSPFRPF